MDSHNLLSISNHPDAYNYHDITDIVFAFGPGNTFLFQTTTAFVCNDLPDNLQDFFNDTAGTKRIASFSFTSYDKNHFTALFERSDGARFFGSTDMSSAATQSFISWLKGNSLRQLRFDFSGPVTHFATTLSDNGHPICRWIELPAQAEVHLQGFIGNNLEGYTDFGWIPGKRPVQVVVGINGAFIILLSDGTAVWSCGSDYPRLHNVLTGVKMSRELGIGSGKGIKIMYVAMSPFEPNYYFILFSDGSASWNVPPVYDHQVREASNEILHRFNQNGNNTQTPHLQLQTGQIGGLFNQIEIDNNPLLQEDYVFNPPKAPASMRRKSDGKEKKFIHTPSSCAVVVKPSQDLSMKCPRQGKSVPINTIPNLPNGPEAPIVPISPAIIPTTSTTSPKAPHATITSLPNKPPPPAIPPSNPPRTIPSPPPPPHTPPPLQRDDLRMVPDFYNYKISPSPTPSQSPPPPLHNNGRGDYWPPTDTSKGDYWPPRESHRGDFYTPHPVPYRKQQELSWGDRMASVRQQKLAEMDEQVEMERQSLIREILEREEKFQRMLRAQQETKKQNCLKVQAEEEVGDVERDIDELISNGRNAAKLTEPLDGNIEFKNMEVNGRMDGRDEMKED